MKVIQVTTPKFEYKGVAYWAEEKMFGSWVKWAEYATSMKEKGATHCFIYSASNVNHKDEIIHPVGDDTIDILFVRYKFATIKNTCPECGYPTFQKHHESFERCEGCDWTTQ